PKARIYLPGLLNWVQFDQAKSIMQSLPILWNHIYQESEYGNKALERPVDPHFTSPDLYKHHFQIMHLQFQELSELDTKERYQKIRQWLLNASQYYKEISDSGIALDPHGRGDHVSAWLEAIDRFASEYI
ncbi:MAG: hypothetical protein RL120_08875, partial [Gammaproteobacteria bacterium]